MVVFGSKSSSAKTKLFEQPLDKLLSPKTVKQLNEAIRRQNSKLSTNNIQANGSSYQRINNYYANNSNNKLLLNNSNSFSNDSDIIRDPDEEERCRLLMLNVLPEPIKRLLAELYARGPSTVGIFRKSPNAKHCKELRQKLETSDGLSSIEQFQVNVIASVFKVFFDLLETVADYCRRWQEAVTVEEWLRSLPDCLLMSRLYPQWIDIAKLIEPLHLDKMRQQQVQQQQQQRDLATNAGIENVDVELHSQQITTQQTTTMTSGSSNDVRMQTMLSMTAFELRERHSECIRIVRQLLDALNETNLILLRAIVCVLWHIAGNAEYNKMCSNNLGVCIGQSLLNDEHQRKQHKSRRSSSLGLSNTLMQSSNHNLHTTSNHVPISPPSSSALRHFSTSTFAKRHRRSRSQGLLASTLSLTNLSSHLSSSPSACVTSNQRISSSSITNLKQQVNSNNNNNNSYSPNNYLNTNDAQEAAKYVPILVAFMIDNAVDLFGSNIVNLFGPRPPPSTDVEDENLSPTELRNESLQQQQQQQQSSCLTKSMEVDDNLVICSPASSTSKNEEGADRDSGHDDDNDHDQQQQRPLSAAESTTSSSRASSSTSGVHSQSPAFSNESTNDYRCQSGGGGSNSSDNGVDSGTRGSHRRSLSTSISPDSSVSSSTSNTQSICTSPNADDMDTVDGMVIIHHHHHDQHHIDVDFTQQQQKQQQLLIKHRLSESQLNARDDDGIHVVAGDRQMSKLVDSDESHQFVGCINRQMETATATTARIVNRLNLTSKASNSERPKSMVNLRALEDVFAHQHTSNLINNNLNDEQQQQQQQQEKQQHSKKHANQQFASQHNDYANFVAAGGDMDGNSKATASKRINNNNYNDNQFQSQTLNRYSSRQQQQQKHQQHPVMFNRLPKIPFQYTTSCYGGEAVVYYPSNAHISQQRQQEQQRLHHQQQSYPSLHRGCNRIQSLDRQSGSHRQHLQQQQHQHHHQQMPQRSHVMMLRDYYLSLQEQSHRQQHQAQFISSNQRATGGGGGGGGTASSISQGNYMQRVQLQQQQQERQYLQRQHSTSQQLVAALNNTAVTRLQHQNLQSMQSLDLSRPSTLVHRFSSASSHDLYPPTPAPTTNSAYVSAANNGGITESIQQQQQPASAAIAYQRIRPRLARIRQNQFNGLYVKRASSPHSITTSSATGNGTGLIVRPLDDCELSSAAAAAKVAASVVSKSACAASLMAVSQSSLSQQSSKMSSSTSGSTEHSADDDESDDCSTEWMESTMV